MSKDKTQNTTELVKESTVVNEPTNSINVDKKSKSKKHQLVATVMTNKMNKTITVRVINNVLHSKYKKVVKKYRRYMAHNELEGINIGDKVRIIESRPMSKNTKWVVMGKLSK